MQAQAVASHQYIFTDYVRLLDTAEKEPAPGLIEEVLLCLWRGLCIELKKRGLWDLSPSYLGIYGLTSWEQASVRSVEHLNTDLGEGWELVIECFRYIFIDRFRYLVRQLKAKPHIDGLIFRNIKNFLHDTQKKHDPLGFRVFILLHAAVMEEVRSGKLKVLAGDFRIRNTTLLGFSEEATTMGTMDLADIVRIWNNVLLPDLITARGKEKDQVVATLGSLLRALPAKGVRGFHFSDLLKPLKADIRARWSSLFDVSEGETAVEQGDQKPSNIVRLIDPDVSLEEKDTFEKLVDCVTQSMKKLDETPITRRHLKRLWSFLRIYAGDPDEKRAARGREAIELELTTTKNLSRRRLAETLKIPRNRMTGLFAILGSLVERCRNTLGQPPGSSTARGVLRAGPGNDHATVLEGLRQGVAEARRRASTQAIWLQAQPHNLPEPGDLYFLDLITDLEWSILEQDPQDSSRFLAVPADPNPLSGSADVTVPKEASSGPLTLRCDHAVWLNVAELDPKMRTGTLEPTFLRQAQDKQRQLRARTLIGSELEQEVDIDPDYIHWVDEILKPARVLVERSSSKDVLTGEVVAFTSPKRSGWSPSAYSVAASILLVVTLGLSGGLIWQQQRIQSADRKLADLEEQLSGVQQEQQRVQQAHTELQRNRERAEREYQQQIADLRTQLGSRQGFDVQVNPPMVIFREEERVRAKTKTIEISSGDVMFSLIIAVEDMAARYRLQILRRDTGEPIWTRGSLKPNEFSELSLLVPTNLVPPGGYRFRLETMDEDRVELVGEYGLTLEVQ